MKKYAYLFVVLAGCLMTTACKKQAGTVNTAAVEAYLSLQTGKYIEYRLDSTRYVHFGQQDTIVSYYAREVVEGTATDGTGRPAYRVVRYLRNWTGTTEADYTPTLTYYITPTRESIEVAENNLRYQKLRLPVTEGYSWRGNSFLPATPFYYLYQFSNDEDMDRWEYTYQDVNLPLEIAGTSYDSTVTVLQVADSSNVPIIFPEGLAYRNYWVEQYAKNIGLIYKEVVMWEYQPPNGGNPGFRSGFGLKMSIIGHN